MFINMFYNFIFISIVRSWQCCRISCACPLQWGTSVGHIRQRGYTPRIPNRRANEIQKCM